MADPEIKETGGNEPVAAQISPTEFYNAALEEAGGDMSKAVVAITSEEEALKFALGLADSSGYGDNHSAGYASAVITTALSKAIGPNSPDYDLEAYLKGLNLWGVPLDFMKTAQNTPGMWSALLEGRDFAEVAERDDVYYSPEKFEAATKLFAQAGVQVEPAAA